MARQESNYYDQFSFTTIALSFYVQSLKYYIFFLKTLTQTVFILEKKFFEGVFTANFF